MALVARDGLDLDAFGLRYSHAGFARADAGRAGRWAVRQLYFACDEGRPRIFDQGLTAFLLGSANPRRGHVRLLLPPPAAAAALARAANDDALARALRAPSYAANAHPWSTRHQNCNQWALELLAQAWGAPRPAGALDETRTDALRAASQRWLAEAGYEPSVLHAGWLMPFARHVRWLRDDDQPAADQAARVYRVTMPEAIERFVRTREPGTRSVEACHTPERLVLRVDGPPLPDDCRPAAGDRVVDLR